MVILGIPTLCRYQLLEDCIQSAMAGTVRPDKVIVIDNGGGYKSSLPMVTVIRPQKNIGVAASWNLLHKLSDPADLVISNDDARFDVNTIAELLAAPVGLALADGFVCFRLSHESHRKVGLFDENFYPAYFEDNDYVQRCHLTGVQRTDIQAKVFHHGSATIATFSNHERADFNNKFNNNRAYYIKKWGGPPHYEKFVSPFNDTPKMDINEFRQVCYANACYVPSDISEHCPVLYELAKECNHITELGTSQCNSTIALLNARPRRLVCYADHTPARFGMIEAVKGNTELVLNIQDTLTADIEPTDLLFIDTKHTYDHLKAELAQHYSKVSKYIVVHDTVVFGSRGEGGGEGLMRAISEFSSHLVVARHLTNNNGLTILRR